MNTRSPITPPLTALHRPPRPGPHRRPNAGRALLPALTAIVLAAAVDHSHAAGDAQVTDAGTVVSFALPLGAAAAQWWLGDREGVRQLAFTWTSSVVLAEVLKQGTNRTRPDGTNDLSFPSGHAARAFAAASHVNRRYGMEAAWPLYAGAVAVGWTRVQARRHDWLDVAGSLAVSEWMARTWSSPRTGAPAVAAARTEGGWQLQLSWAL